MIRETQFRLRALLLAITALAVAFGLMRCSVPLGAMVATITIAVFLAPFRPSGLCAFAMQSVKSSLIIASSVLFWEALGDIARIVSQTQLRPMFVVEAATVFVIVAILKRSMHYGNIELFMGLLLIQVGLLVVTAASIADLTHFWWAFAMIYEWSVQIVVFPTVLALIAIRPAPTEAGVLVH